MARAKGRSGSIESLVGPSRVPPAHWALRVLAGAGVFAVLAVAAALYRYPVAVADDYSYASKASLHGPFGAIVWDYRNWTGRWTCIGALTVSWSAMDLSDAWTYRALLVAMALVSAAAFHFFLCTILEQRSFSLRAIAMTLGFLALYWAGMLAPGEGLCWLSSVVGYQTGGVGILVVTAGLMRLGRQRSLARWIRVSVLAALAVYVPGTNELLGLVLCMVLGLGTLIALWKKTPTRWAWLAVTVAAAVGLAFVAAAPGNAVRRALYPRSMDLRWALDFTLSHLREFLPIWLGDGRLWAATFLFWLAADSAGLHPRWLARKDIAWLLWIPLGWAAAVVAMFFVPAFATGDHLPFRAYNSVYMGFLVGWFLIVLAVRSRLAASEPGSAPRGGNGAWPLAGWLAVVTALYMLWGHAPGDDLPNLPRKNGWLIHLGFAAAYLAAFLAWAVRFRRAPSPVPRRALRALLLIAWPAALLWTGNAPCAWSDLSRREGLNEQGRAILEPSFGKDWVLARRTRLEWFDLQMRRRRDFIRQQAAAGHKQVMVPPVFHWPRTFFRSDLTPNPDYWTNRELCPFFDIDRIVMGPGFAAR